MLALFIVGCKKEAANSAAVSTHSNYSGFVPGRFVIYDATEMVHDDALAKHDTTRFWLKTKIGEEFIDNEGRTAREFLRYKSTNQGQSWLLTDVWSCVVNGDKFEIVEENQRVVKLLLPPRVNKEWDQNIFNTYEEKNVFYTKVHTKLFYQNIYFDSVLYKTEDDFFSLVDYRKQSEVYAKNVGLINKYYKNLVINNFDTLNIRQGTEQYLEILSYGLE